MFGVFKRLSMLLLVLGVVAAPAAILDTLCFGASCTGGVVADRAAPFCGLPHETRRLIAAGFRENRSPDVLATTVSSKQVASDTGRMPVPWPTKTADTRVPIFAWGQRIRSGELPAGTRLDSIAPTLEGLLGIRRPHPEVRSGRALDMVEPGPPLSLVVTIAWKGIGTRDLRSSPDSWPFLKTTGEAGASSVTATTASLPLDPAAALATIGSGAVPAAHGVVGERVRADDGSIVEAFSAGAPLPVIAFLGDDLDRATRNKSKIGVVGTTGSDAGLIGGSWYPASDDDLVLIGADPVELVREAMLQGFGDGGAPDLLGIALEGSVRQLDTWTEQIAAAISNEAGGTVAFLVAATGSIDGDGALILAQQLLSEIETPLNAPVVAAETPGGFFLDRAVQSKVQLSADDVAAEMKRLRAPDGRVLFADAYASYAVALARYCR